MASEEPSNPMAESGVTIRSDSEQYSAGEDISTSPPSSNSPPLVLYQPPTLFDISTSPPSSNSPPLVLYQPPTLFGIIRGAAINLFLPFINGMMLGFGELFAHEAAFRLGWSGTRIFPLSRRQQHPAGPGIEVRDRPKTQPDLDDLTSLE